MNEVEKDRNFYETSGGVTFSGGEVLAHGAYALEIAQEVKRRGFSLAVETSGYGLWADLRPLTELADWVLYDLKHMDPEKHRYYTGVTPDLIWQNLRDLTENPALRKKIIVRVPMIHGVNDDAENIAALRDFMLEKKLTEANLLPYHNMGIGKAHEAGMEQVEFGTPSDEILTRAAECLRKAGIQTTIMGREET